MNTEHQNRIMAMLHARTQRLEKGEPISPPIVSSAKYYLPGAPDVPNVYGRDANATVETTEDALRALEDAHVVAFPSGMAAITAALMSTLKSGDRILLPSDGYFVTRALSDEILSAFDVQTDTLPTPDYNTVDMSGYALVWVETPSNPRLDLCDIEHVARRAKATGATVIADNTTLTPLLQRPLDLGADIVVASDTKAIAGHSDVLFGHVATRRPDLYDKIRQWRKLSGAVAGPWEAFLVHRGLMTLEVRLSRMCSNAKALTGILQNHPAVSELVYPGIGFVMTLTLEDETAAEKFINECPAIFPSTSFGGVHTSAERRARWGDDVPQGHVRLSVGCEPEAALLEAVRTTLEQI